MFPLIRENIRIALGSIKTQLLRTILTVLIIGIGIMALVGILSAVSALENTIASDFSSMGTNTFNIKRYGLRIRVGNGPPGRGNKREIINPVISYSNIREFVDKYDYPGARAGVAFWHTQNIEVKYENKKTDPTFSIAGVNEHYIGNSGREISEGRLFNSFDIQNNNAVCVIGSGLIDALLDNVDPIGQTISIRGNKFKVIGVLKEKASAFGNNENLGLFIPIQKARTIFTNPNINYDLSVMVDNKDMIEGAQQDATLLFRNIRKLSPIEENNFSINRSDDLLQRIGSISQYLYYAAWIISIVTILGSSIALMNIMLVSVSERTREIGVRKALGAKQRTIAGQFFIETILIGQLGGIVGILLGVLIGLGFSSLLELNFSIPWFAMFWAILISFIVAIISGFYPANKASKLDPIESLRYE